MKKLDKCQHNGKAKHERKDRLAEHDSIVLTLTFLFITSAHDIVFGIADPLPFHDSWLVSGS